MLWANYLANAVVPVNTKKDSTAAAMTRAVAARLIASLIDQQGSLSSLLPASEQSVAESDRGLLRELCYGVARWYPRHSAIIKQLLRKPLRRKDYDVLSLLHLGLHQLDNMRIPPHATLDMTVDATRELGKAWASGLVNALLRRYQRDRAELVGSLRFAELAACPPLFEQLFRGDWPDQFESLCHAANRHPPLTLRVNNRLARDSYRSLLEDNGIACHGSVLERSAIILEQAISVDQVPGFSEGQCSVQDASAQRIARVLAPRPGEHILDACAAPGGKTGHILELCESVELTALDRDERRLERVGDNLRRLGFADRARTLCADATDVQQWWDGEQFDAIVLDAPCSGSGVLRRQPDIKLLRTEDHITALVELQKCLLEALWPLLKPGGRLLYATCSVLLRENEQQMKAFTERHTDAKPVELKDEQFAVHTGIGYQILGSDDHDGDGFYYALLQRDAH